MFFDASRINAVRRMILAEDGAGRAAALEELLPEQRADFAQIFEIMAGLPVTIRLLDPPLHEFLPSHEGDFEEVAKDVGIPVDTLRRRVGELHEFNPMPRAPRLPPRHYLPRDLRDAGARHLRGRGRRRQAHRRDRGARGDGAAGRDRARA